MPHGRGLKHPDVRHAVETRCPVGHAQVLRCHPLRRSSERCEPFPTLFWLVCPELTRALSRLEHAGWITRLQARIAEDEPFRAEVERDHEAYVRERWSLLSAEERAEVARRGLAGELLERGIGGTRDRGTVKCLHLHYAHHLARGSAIGRALDAAGVPAPCGAGPARA